MSEAHVTHYCSCIEDNPEAQEHIFEVAETVNRLIREDGAKFSKKHNLYGADYETILIVDLNGNYKIVNWCSNRTAKVARLEKEYNKMASKHMKLYRDAMEEMHETYLNAQTTKAQQGAVE